MKVIVSGSRVYSRSATIWAWLDGLYARYGDDLIVIQGGAQGADFLAKQWAENKWGKRSENSITIPADWDKYNKAAGGIRNQKMIDDCGPIDLVLCFKDTFNWDMDKGGTEDMARRAENHDIPCFVVQKVFNYEKF